jgi:hypothetical protein
MQTIKRKPMRILDWLRIAVTEPFSGGWLIIKNRDVVLSKIYLPPLRPPDYSGIDSDTARYLDTHHLKNAYFFQSDRLYLYFEGELDFVVDGEPKESVMIEPHWAF